MPNPENLIGKGFDKNPKNINRTGANRKSFSSINKILKDKGIKILSKAELVETYALLFNCTEEEIEAILEEDEIPIGFKHIAEEFSDPKLRRKAFNDLRDYTFGKAIENVEVTSSVTIFELPSNGREGEDK
jgi:hypothetical protein